MGLQTINVIPPDLAEMYGRYEATRQRAEKAEQALINLQDTYQAMNERLGECVFLLLKHGVDVPRRAVNTDLSIGSADGVLTVRVPGGVVLIESGAAANEVIVQLMDQERAAFPDSFPEVF